MSRTDQFIGLTQDAKNFLEQIRENYEFLEYYQKLVNEDDSLCGETFDGQVLRIYPENDPVNDYFEYVESIQCVPWSSGPMYFTYLREYLKKKSSEQYLKLRNCFKWVENPTLLTEFDREKGHMNV